MAVGNNYQIKEKTGLNLDKYLSDPQGFNSYSYARNNPLKLIDEDGAWFKEFLMGQQSWSSFQLEVGEAANQLGQNSPTLNAAMDHPYVAGAAVGIGVGAGAYGTVAVGSQIAVGIRLGTLSQLPMADRVNTIANRGFDAIQKATGFTKSGAIQTIQSTGKSLVDMRPGNVGYINTISTVADKAIRITTTSNASKIISAGVISPASKVGRYISSGAIQAVPVITSIAQSITRAITSLIK
ncbi:TPA: hypothetical protein DEB72_00550 [Patescibacteria group bacterium]|nr:hypothetical protein [Patescibacteria group bacterium]